MITRWPVAGSRGSPRLASLIYLRKPCHERVLTSSLSTKRSSPLAMPARKWKERRGEKGKGGERRKERGGSTRIKWKKGEERWIRREKIMKSTRKKKETSKKEERWLKRGHEKLKKE